MKTYEQKLSLGFSGLEELSLTDRLQETKIRLQAAYERFVFGPTLSAWMDLDTAMTTYQFVFQQVMIFNKEKKIWQQNINLTNE